MPELPDLEVFKINIFNRLTSKRLEGFDVFDARRVQAVKERILRDLPNRELLRIDRIGKELIFDFGDDQIIAAHLMLSGAVSIVPQAEVATISSRIFALRFERETLVFSDRGGLCTVKYMPQLSRTPDAFADAFTWEYFLGVVRSKARANVKAFLIDQSVVKGIGNAYADEILWHARVSPHSVVGCIPPEALRELYDAIGIVLRDAIEQIRRIAPNTITGEERSFLKVHNRALKTTATGYAIRVEKIATKTTYFTDEQVVYS